VTILRGVFQLILSAVLFTASCVAAACDAPDVNTKALFQLLEKPQTTAATILQFARSHRFKSFPLNESCETPVLAAIRLDREDLLPILSKEQGNPKLDMPQLAYIPGTLKDSMYSYALRFGTLKMLETFKAKGAGDLSIVCANENDYPRSGVFPKGCTDLQIASSANPNVDLIQDLIAKGSPVNVNAANSQGKTALMYAGHNLSPAIIPALLQAGADAKATAQADFTLIYGPYHHLIKDETVLMFAAGQGAPAAAISALLQANPNAGASTSSGETALMLAALGGAKADVITVLLQASANINAKTPEGNTALIMAGIGAAPVETISALLQATPEIDAVNTDGDSALLIAVKNNASIESIQALLNAHANVNLTNNEKTTALMNAAWIGSAELIKALIQAGAKLSDTDKNGKSALDNAKLIHRSADILALLTTH